MAGERPTDRMASLKWTSIEGIVTEASTYPSLTKDGKDYNRMVTKIIIDEDKKHAYILPYTARIDNTERVKIHYETKDAGLLLIPAQKIEILTESGMYVKFTYKG